MQLTDEQRAIIEAEPEHCLITAVAGSGKTTTLAHRICYLLRQGQDPKRILVLMFNRAAKQDFEKKLRKVAGDDFARLPEIRTYHAMGLRLYQRFIREGCLPPYRGDILSEGEIHFQLFNLLRHFAPGEMLDEIKRNKKEFIELAATLLDISKTTLLSPADTFASLGYPAKHRFLTDILERFEHWRKQQSRISFADMLFEPVACLQAHPELEKLVADKMDIVLVDEYQDTNEIQHLLLKHIAGQRARVTVVGDPDQTIYEFRGARPEYILKRFARDFNHSREFNLSYTFRYGHQVALMVNHLISHNQGRKKVLCRAHPGNPKTEVVITHTADEPGSLLGDLRQAQQSGRNLAEIAILVRLWSQAVSIELALLAAGIPYHIAQGKGALTNREVNQVLALMEIASGRISRYPLNQRQEIFSQLLRFPHIGLKEEHLREMASGLARQEGFWADYLLNSLPDSLHRLQKKKIRKTAMAWRKLTNNRKTSDRILAAYMQDVALTASLSELALTEDSAEERLQHIFGMAHYLRSLKLPALATLHHFDELRQRAKTQEKSAGLTLTSMHQTKGREWPCVMITGLSEQTLPCSVRNQEKPGNHLQSERRLFYVAMTRVRERLYLYAPRQDAQDTERESQPSRFIDNMEMQISAESGHFLDNLPTDASQESPQPAFLPQTPLTALTREYLGWHKIPLPDNP